MHSTENPKKTILIVDDDEMVLFLAKEKLQECGFAVNCAQDSESGITLFREAFEAGTPFYAVILDLNIPGGPGGKEIFPLLRAIDPDVRAFISSGDTFDPLIVDYKQHGICGIVEKPHSYLGKKIGDIIENAIAEFNP